MKRPTSAYSNSSHGLFQGPGRKISARSLNTASSELSTMSRRSALSLDTVRHKPPATQQGPEVDGRGRRDAYHAAWAYRPERGPESARIAEALKRKEWERSEKWRKMAKVIKGGAEGAATVFEFDTEESEAHRPDLEGNSGLLKRSAAWHSFLASSSRAANSLETDEHIIAEFHRLQDVSSPDDVQIDLDVPRTINRHIMFRKRYRGGQQNCSSECFTASRSTSPTQGTSRAWHLWRLPLALLLRRRELLCHDGPSVEIPQTRAAVPARAWGSDGCTPRLREELARG